MRYLIQDWTSNRGNLRARLALVLFRTSQVIRRAPHPFRRIAIPLLVIYRIVVEWVLCIELPWNTQVGPGLRLFHGMGLVLNGQTVMAHNVVLRHTTTIGVKETLPFGTQAAPIIGDDVDTGPHVIILGPITVGNGARMGAGSVVVKDVPAGATVVGNPARVIHLAVTPEAKYA